MWPATRLVEYRSHPQFERYLELRAELEDCLAWDDRIDWQPPEPPFAWIDRKAVDDLPSLFLSDLARSAAVELLTVAAAIQADCEQLEEATVYDPHPAVFGQDANVKIISHRHLRGSIT